MPLITLLLTLRLHIRNYLYWYVPGRSLTMPDYTCHPIADVPPFSFISYPILIV